MTGNSAENKKVVLVLHADKDGIDSGYIMQKMIELASTVNGEKTEIEVLYCDAYNSEKVFEQIFKGIKNIGNTKLFITDTPLASESIVKKIEELNKKGLDVFLSDHHKNNLGELTKDYSWAYCEFKENRCSTTENLLALIKYFGEGDYRQFLKKNLNIENGIDVSSDMYTKMQNEKNYINEQLGILNNNEKFNNLVSFFERMLGKSSKIRDKFLENDFLNKFTKLSITSKYCDFGRMKELPGLVDMVKYLNLATPNPKLTQIEGIDKKDISLVEVINMIMDNKIIPSLENMPNSVEKLKSESDRISLITKPQKRHQLSLNNAKYYNVKDARGNRSNIAVLFGDSDIRFDIEGYRTNVGKLFKENNLNYINIDHVFTLTSNLVGDAIATDKPTIKRIKKCNRNTGKLTSINKDISMLDVIHKIKFEGSSSGVALPYDKDVLRRITELREEIIKQTEIAERHTSGEVTALMQVIINAKTDEINRLTKEVLEVYFEDVREINPTKKNLKLSRDTTKNPFKINISRNKAKDF